MRNDLQIRAGTGRDREVDGRFVPATELPTRALGGIQPGVDQPVESASRDATMV
ncbi:MAG: hypothetical protein JO023_26320, partial [Chloroflexi bacterium]|nr:hypothetical protein [Chloroflexota bacterium]